MLTHTDAATFTLTVRLYSRPLFVRRAGPPALPIEVQVALSAPLFTRVASLMMGYVACLSLCLFAMIRVGGSWPTDLMAALFGSLTMHLVVILLSRRSGRRAAAAGRLRLRRPYQVVGLLWCCVGSTLNICCVVVAHDEFLRLMSCIMTAGICAGISSRNAGTPRYAAAQIAVWMVPMIPLSPRLGTWYYGLSVLAAIYVAAMVSIVRQQYADTLQLIDAERESRLAREALAEREAELLAIFANAAAGVAEFDPHRVIRVNRALSNMLGVPEAVLLGGLDPATLVHPEDRADDQADWDRIFTTGATFASERRFVRPDGGVITLQLSVSVAATGADGRPTRVVAIMQDITAQKAAEAALRASEDMLRLSLDIGRVGSYRRDLRQNAFFCGKQTRLMHSLPDDDSPVTDAAWLSLLLPEDRERVAKLHESTFADRRTNANFDYRFVHPVEGIRHIETRSRVEYDSAGVPIQTVGVMIDVTDRRLAEARIAHLAHHDPLTGLPNRALFRTRLDEALEHAQRGTRFALLCLDLDHFKMVNDTLGHPVGDALLMAVTARLKSALRQVDTVARLGGDEFAFIQCDIGEGSDITALAERLIAAVSAPYTIEGHHVVIGTSVGIAVSPDDGLDADVLLRLADTALYGAKGAGRGRYRFFEHEMEARMLARRALELDLRRALQEDAFELSYQPVVSVATRETVGYEALLRWHHNKRGLVMPDKFIPLAEATGLIVPIGEWALRRACADAAGWAGSARVAVNLSAVQISSQTLEHIVATALVDSGLDPGRLELEITETTMLNDTEATLDTLHRLKAMGVAIALDDFGTGYSSLSYLQRFPFDKVKIDRSFVTPLGHSRESAAIVGAVIALCAGLDMRTTAEGVETEAQFAALARIGCTEAQGNLFRAPRPAGDFRMAEVEQGKEGLLF